MLSYLAGELALADTAPSGGTTWERAHAVLGDLRRVMAFDAAFLAFADPLGGGYHRLASLDLDPSAVERLSGPQPAGDIEATGTDRACPPLGPSDLPYPADELPTWAECLIPSGLHDGRGVALFSTHGRLVGHLAVLYGSRRPPSASARRLLARLRPLMARAVDPLVALSTAARLVRGATAGVVLFADGGCLPLPGMRDDPLLAHGSPVLDAARARTGDGHVCSSFLWRVSGAHAPDGHVRVTVLAAPEDAPPGVTAVALLSPAGDLHGLTARELEVLGLLVEGCCNQEIARVLVLAQRTVAAHLEHVLAKLGAPSRTLAAVRAQRDGLYVPAPPGVGAGRHVGGEKRRSA